MTIRVILQIFCATEANTRNAELFVRARRDLAEITVLSEHIKKNTEELSKAVKQSP